jgi:hypothetical protein
LNLFQNLNRGAAGTMPARFSGIPAAHERDCFGNRSSRNTTHSFERFPITRPVSSVSLGPGYFHDFRGIFDNLGISHRFADNRLL